MHPVTLGFGIATAAVMGLSLLAKGRERPHALITGCLLGASWLVTAAIMPNAPPSLIAWPAVDVISISAFGALWGAKPDRWKLVILLALIGQCVMHAAFWLTELSLGPAPYDRVFRYEVAINALCAVQLVAGSTPGARRVGGFIRDWVPVFRPDRVRVPVRSRP